MADLLFYFKRNLFIQMSINYLKKYNKWNTGKHDLTKLIA